MKRAAAKILVGALCCAVVPALAGTLVGSKHDLTSFNARAQVEAMTGLAFNDYRDPCIYCHIPDNIKDKRLPPGKQQIEGWNRYMPMNEIETYKSETIKGKVGTLGAESLLCLSCHDGSMAVDMVVNKPQDWTSQMDAPLHMRLDKGGGLERCTQCHDGVTAHKMDQVIIGSNLMDDHPVGIRYPGLLSDPDYYSPNQEGKFRNGVRLFNSQVECATCHNVHDPDLKPFLRVEQRELCLTCHNK